MRAKSPKKKTASPEEIEKFVSGANYAEEEAKEIYAWKNKKLDKNKVRKLTVRLPEEYALKLDFLSDNSVPKLIKQRFFLENLMPLIDKEIEKRGLPK